ncbi:hypothetical protein ACLMJK_007159 [Lecanora helva]
MATFPYNPTTLLYSQTSNDTIYILQPDPRQSGHPRLLSLNVTRSLGSTNLPYATITPSVPILEADRGGSYITAIDQEGNISIYSGNCNNGTSGSSFWRFEPAQDGVQINGTWQEADLNVDSIDGRAGLSGANYLASAIAFSSTGNASSGMYIFGGMCPDSASSTQDDWTQAATYSNSMLTIEPDSMAADTASSYNLGISSSRGPPIAEAGFSITPLQPTFFSSGNSNDSNSRNQNFVLLGGHTQVAFINMSQVALFSLPEQSWTFLPVDLPSPDPNTELAARDNLKVDSRSGHTALLTSDGRRVVVFGGWVGDVNTPADPQLVVLELGEGYGGSGDWQWSIPKQTGPGLAQGSGLYGHGAIMLAGDVMMIVGGYQISAPSQPKNKRGAPSSSTLSYYFNTSSNIWSTTYIHPKISINSDAARGGKAEHQNSSRKIGLGVGIAFGMLVIAAVILFYFWYSRRLKCRRNAREDELRRLAAGPHPLHMTGVQPNVAGRGTSEMSTVDWGGASQLSIRGASAYSSVRNAPEAERSGLLFEVPSPTRGLRRSLHSRGTYQPTSWYDEGRRGLAFSTIHPIDERDEYDEDPVDGISSEQNEMLQRDEYNVMSNVPILDPFQDPTSGSRSPSPQSPQERELEIRRWVEDWSAADALMHSQAGRRSPEKTDRTSSTLSDQSARSGFSSHSLQHSVGTISRSISQRSAALFNATPFRSTTPIDFSQHNSELYGSEHRRARSLTLNLPAQRHSVADSYATAPTPSACLQSEGEALLGDIPASGEPSPVRSHSRAKGWMGSVRRVLTGLERSTSTSPEHNESTSSSPTKRNYTNKGLPRRAASTGATLWQKRQGARDWETGNNEARRDDATASKDDDEDWDVESAVERRVVQVMFTVPKEKLRVINRGPEGDGESLMSAEVKNASEESDEHEKKGKGKGRE